MKTILVVFCDGNKTEKRYAYNTSSDVTVGDYLLSKDYGSKFRVAKVLEESFTYYNSQTGEMSNKFTSTMQKEIKQLEVRNEETDIVYCIKIAEKVS